MVRGQQKGEAKADKGKGYEDRGVKVGLRYPTDNPQGKEQDIDGADTVQHGQKKKEL
jgi:hypothetical protein